MEEKMALTYANYLKLDELLSLQQPRSESPEHDEMLFIIIHQVYELWFKEILHELDHLVDLVKNDRIPQALHTFKRILTILKVQVSQMDILETMTPLEFRSFRDRLESASGFQSFQFREVELALGLKNQRVMATFPEGSAERARLEARLEAPTLWDAFIHLLSEKKYPVPEEVLNRDVTRSIEPCEELRQVLIRLYRENNMLTHICELLTDLDEALQEWRYRHVKMVERMIGNLPGTGGSSGVDYLKGTLFKPLFPDLWSIPNR